MPTIIATSLCTSDSNLLIDVHSIQFHIKEKREREAQNCRASEKNELTNSLVVTTLHFNITTHFNS